MARTTLAPTIRVFHSLAELAPLRGALISLNAGARRPSPFATLDYLEALLAHDEHVVPGAEPIHLVAFDGDADDPERVVAWLPLRRVPRRVFGVTERRIELLATHDVDRFGMVARAEDEARCADAFLDHLVRHLPFDELVFAQQDATSPLRRALHRPGLLHQARLFPGNPNCTLPLAFASGRAWFESLGKHHRQNVTRLGRRLLREGTVESVRGRGAAAAGLLELYLDVERRSWKAAGGAGIGRSKERRELFQAQCVPRGSADGVPEPVVHLLLLDGVPIAGHFGVVFGDGLYAREIAFDEAYAHDAPGHLLLIEMIVDAIGRGLGFVNFMSRFAYYKGSWGAEVIETADVQVFRVGSLPWLRARLGDVRRGLERVRARVRGNDASSSATTRSNPARVASVHAAEEHREPPGKRARDRASERALATRVLGDLQGRGVPVERRAGAELLAHLPFSLGDAQRRADRSEH